MPKRKSVIEGEPAGEAEPRRSVRLRKSADTTAAPTEAKFVSQDERTVLTKRATPKTKVEKEQLKTGVEAVTKKVPSSKEQTGAKRRARKVATGSEKPAASGDAADTAPNGSAAGEGERNCWLLKAEPESRFENGIDVKFSIDDLAAKTEPEPWDGIRAYAARNNLRAMKKGDLAFFYHSNCKEPGIVGTMEIVQEHSPDLSAHDPKAPYYDPSSKPSDPKWSVVHVRFRSKLAAPIGLKELREMGGPGKPLEKMQMLKQTRLSVSKVSAAEWEYLTRVAEERAMQT
ncbi:DUF55-domain-containing protein [Parathielavia hyrcaniae]|uniref:Thymocyte nuclear protein 1 n=1 Tax=Parathielavia hyrcaniae TaxID=113614 RepID=A0AAN6Q5M3_9PEZI|nr:DUF55-domain-containing protein [Parathielavia hyrcaniae]